MMQQDGVSLSELEQLDPHPVRGTEDRFWCPFPACADKTKTPSHRSLVVNRENGLWMCHRCGARGVLQEFQTARPSHRQQAVARRRAAFGVATTYRIDDPFGLHPPVDTRTPVQLPTDTPVHMQARPSVHGSTGGRVRSRSVFRLDPYPVAGFVLPPLYPDVAVPSSDSHPADATAVEVTRVDLPTRTPVDPYTGVTMDGELSNAASLPVVEELACPNSGSSFLEPVPDVPASLAGAGSRLLVPGDQHTSARPRVYGHAGRQVQATGSGAAQDTDLGTILRRAHALSGTAGDRYLNQRGIPTTLADRCGVRFVQAWYGRPAVLFPLVDAAGSVVAVQGRYIDRRDPRIRDAGQKRRGVFVVPGALLPGVPLVVCEAPIDALSLAAAGVPAIALCGTAAPEWLADVAAFRRVLLALDADSAGDAAAERLEPVIGSFGARVRRLRPLMTKDWNDELLLIGRDAIQDLVRSALS